MKKIKEVELDFKDDEGHPVKKKFKLTMFNPDNGFDLVLRLAKIIGPALLALQATDPEKDAGEAIAELMRPMFSNLDVADTKQLVYDLLSCVIHENKTLTQYGGNVLNPVFSGNYMKIFILCKEVVIHNRFLDEVADLTAV